MPKTVLLGRALALVCLSTVSFLAVDAKPVVVRVGYLPATHDSLLFVAKELNLFDTRYIDVQMKPYDNSVQILSDLKGGNIDIGIPGMATPAMEIGGRAPLTIIGGAAARSAALVAGPEFASRFKGAKTAEEKIRLLRLKTVGAVRGSTGLAILKEGIHRVGLPQKEVDLRDFTKPPDIISALTLGNLDAGLLWSPHMTLAKSRGLEIVMWMDEVLPNHVCCRQVARDDFLSQRDAVANYLAGLLKADKILRTARTDSRQKARVFGAVKKYLTTLSDAQLESELFDRKRPMTTVSPDLNRSGIDAYLDAMQTAGLMRPDQCRTVRDKVKEEYLVLAYQKIGCTPAIARICVDKPAERCECMK